MNDNLLRSLIAALPLALACGKVSDGNGAQPIDDAATTDTGGGKPNPDPVALSAEPLDLTTALAPNVVPIVTISGRGTRAGFVPAFLRENVRAQIQLVTLPEHAVVPSTTEITSDPTDTSLVTIAVHPGVSLNTRWYALRVPAITGTKVPVDQQPESADALEVRFHPGSAARVRIVEVCNLPDGKTGLGVRFSEAVQLTGDVNKAFSFTQGGATMSCKNIRVPVPDVSDDFTFDCTADASKPATMRLGAGLQATADGAVESASIDIAFGAVRPTGSGCGVFIPAF